MIDASLNQKGQTFARVCLAVAKSGGSAIDAAKSAEAQYGLHTPVARILKTAVSVGTLDASGAWGSELDGWKSAIAEFLELVRAASIVGRLPGLRRIPLNVRMVRQTGGAKGYWVAEGQPIPVRAGTFSEGTLKPAKVGTIVVVSDELTRSNPLADAILRDDLVRALAEATDTAFFSDSAGTAGETPAGVLHGATAITATSDPRTDLAAMIEAFGGALERAVFVMDPTTATQLSGADYPAIGARGGVLLGVPVITSAGVTRDVAGGSIGLIDPTEIVFGESDMAEVDASREALIVMSDDPSSSGVVTSLFQINAVAIRALMYANWAADASGVLLTGVNY